MDLDNSYLWIYFFLLDIWIERKYGAFLNESNINDKFDSIIDNSSPGNYSIFQNTEGNLFSFGSNGFINHCQLDT